MSRDSWEGPQGAPGRQGVAKWPSGGGPGQGPAVGVLRRGDWRQEAALGVCPGVLERGWRRADLCMWPIYVTRRALSSRNAKTASGAQAHTGGV